MSDEPTKAPGEDVAETAEQAAAVPNESGWVTTEVAAAALHVSPRTVREYIRSGDLEAKSEGEGVTKRWLVSIDAVQTLRDKRSASGEMPRSRRDTAVGDLIAAANAVDVGELVAALRELEHRLGRAEARAELTERTESSLREDLEREREERRQAREEAARAAEYRVRLELTERAESTLREDLQRERERADRLEGERARREHAEHERDVLLSQLEALQETLNATETTSEGEAKGDASGEETDEPRRSWWSRYFGG